ncbi:MAG: DUF1848 domain-containing protein [Acidobacteria bacterium]|nr:DUF1848 domain-containing protein [Acidobacteriota bacterium]
MTLVSASRRTDIPALYAPWFLRRLREGFCHWIHPFNGQVRRVSLRPADTLGIVCWTRQPAPLIPHLEDLQSAGHRFAFHVTVNGYPERIESHNPPAEKSIAAVHRLARALPPDRVWWRYDPLLVSEITPAAWHERNFTRLAQALEGAVRRCYFSFPTLYRKTRRNLDAAGVGWIDPPLETRLEIAGRLAAIAQRHGIRLYSCCDDRLLAAGAGKARCVDGEVFQAGSLAPAPTRPDCGCGSSVDIGAYDTCSFGCACCYATHSRRAALTRLAAHDPEDTLLWRPATLRGQDLLLPVHR